MKEDEEIEEPIIDDEEHDKRRDGDYDDWDNEGYFFVRNKHDPLEMHTKQVQKSSAPISTTYANPFLFFYLFIDK